MEKTNAVSRCLVPNGLARVQVSHSQVGEHWEGSSPRYRWCSRRCCAARIAGKKHRSATRGLFVPGYGFADVCSVRMLVGLKHLQVDEDLVPGNADLLRPRLLYREARPTQRNDVQCLACQARNIRGFAIKMGGYGFVFACKGQRQRSHFFWRQP